MRAATQPFTFATAGYLIRITNQSAGSIAELGDRLAECSDASIFHHTFRTLEQPHFLTEGFSNDFAQWALASANRVELAEQLGALDVRDYLSLAELRSDLHRIVADYCRSHPGPARQIALEPLHFCESAEVVLPLGVQAASLEDFRAGLAQLSRASFHYHFIASRLRLQLRTNDFSLWFINNLGLTTLGNGVNRIDISTSTLDSARRAIVDLVDKEIAA